MGVSPPSCHFLLNMLACVVSGHVDVPPNKNVFFLIGFDRLCDSDAQELFAAPPSLQWHCVRLVNDLSLSSHRACSYVRRAHASTSLLLWLSLLQPTRGCPPTLLEPAAAMPSRPCSPSGLGSWRRSGTWLWYAHLSLACVPSFVHSSFCWTLKRFCFFPEGFPCAGVASGPNQENHEAGWRRQGRRTFWFRLIASVWMPQRLKDNCL